MKLIVTTASGIEAVTKRELVSLGYNDSPALNGRIALEGDFSDVAKLNLYLRTAGRVLIELGSFKATNFDELFDGIKSIAFEDYIAKGGKIIVTAKSVMSKIYALSATQSVAKKAIIERLGKKWHTNEVDEIGERYKIDISIYKDVVSVTLDTSGEGLHKRGYRGLVGDAPLKETLAAALIKLSVWNPGRPFADVFCGSGTFAIEAALMAANIPGGFNRDFDFLHYKYYNEKDFETLKQQAESEIDLNKEMHISGFDIDESQIRLARKHAALAGVGDKIHFQKADMRDFSSSKKGGVIISNPPYGERLLSRKEIVGLYRDYGKMYSRLDGWCCYTLTSVSDFESLFGKKADKKRKIYNGNLECNYYAVLCPKNNVKKDKI